jgi:hypothetical protein
MTNKTFLCPAIREYILQTPLFESEESFVTPRFKTQVDLIVYQKTKVEDSLIELLKRMLIWVESLPFSKVALRKLEIRIYLTPFVKIWCPQQSRKITMCEINSGETEFVGDFTRYIRIWRREDFQKVFFHELLHAYNYDDYVTSHSEAFVEALAVSMHCRWISNIIAKPYADLWQEELKHSQHLASILTSHPYENVQTNVVDYIVVKFQLMCHFEALWDWFTSSSSNEKKSWSTFLKTLVVSIPRLKSKEKCFSLRLVKYQLEV